MSLDELNVQEKKLRFRPTAKVLFSSDSHIEDLRNEKSKMSSENKEKVPSLWSFLNVELTRDYHLEHAEERYVARREKIYSFAKIPQVVEGFMVYGIMHCVESFLFVYTFLPLRVILALYALVRRLLSKCFGARVTHRKPILTPAENCDLLKVIILIVCSVVLMYVDTNILYHLIKSQSVIKLYIFFNILEVGDKLFSAIGQDTIDALFWTATEPRGRKREHLGTLPHLAFAIVYVVLHSILVLVQATTLNVAINSRNKALLTIMMSNNFVELKGSVFKKFDKTNLFQVSCSDVRERFHLTTLLFVVILQTMREYGWKFERFWVMVPDCIAILGAELMVDWIKHAFITRFNELNLDVYRDYTTSLAYDVAQTRQRHAFSDHSDLVARRMGFIPLPLGVVMTRVLISSIKIENLPSILIFVLVYVCIALFKILNSLLILGRAHSLIMQHKQEKATLNSPGSNRFNSPINVSARGKIDIATSPLHPVVDQPRINGVTLLGRNDSGDSIDTITAPPSDLGASAIFANSSVDLKNATLNEELLKVEGDEIRIETVNSDVARSFPNIKGEFPEDEDVVEPSEETLKRSESEPNLNITENDSTTK